MSSQFKIQERTFSAAPCPPVAKPFVVQSSPRPYPIEFAADGAPGERLTQEIGQRPASLLLIDRRIRQLYFDGKLATVPTLVVDAHEETKEIGTVLAIVDFLEQHGTTKSSMLYVVGGGIVQDLGAFAAAMYKRGLPWTFVPTTLLAQGDSCVGGKTALNHRHTKNLLALFSAPRRVVIDTGFLATLSRSDLLSGMGEIFRLCVTGGRDFVDVLARELPAFLDGDGRATSRLIAASLAAKRAVVEVDEFELDLRRSMNYGHSFGHALEALTNYRIPHGVAVTLGILVENEIAHRRGMLREDERDLLLGLGRRIVPDEARAVFAAASLDGILDLLRRDKKTEGTVLKLATLEYIGQMRFIDFVLDDAGEAELRRAAAAVRAQI